MPSRRGFQVFEKVRTNGHICIYLVWCSVNTQHKNKYPPQIDIYQTKVISQYLLINRYFIPNTLDKPFHCCCCILFVVYIFCTNMEKCWFCIKYIVYKSSPSKIGMGITTTLTKKSYLLKSMLKNIVINWVYYVAIGK